MGALCTGRAAKKIEKDDLFCLKPALAADRSA
jgi:hypothetical protein